MGYNDIKIDIQLSKKNLSVNRKSLKLEDNLAGADSRTISNSLHETALELNYAKRRDFSPENEADKIYSFLDKSGLSDKIDINFYQPEEFDTDVYPAIALTGKFHATVYD